MLNSTIQTLYYKLNFTTEKISSELVETFILFIKITNCLQTYAFLFYLYIYPPDSQKSNGGANT